MKRIILSVCLVFGIAMYINVTSSASSGSRWICFKNNDEITVVGKDSKEKKTNCEKHEGTWIEMVESNIQKDPQFVPEAPKQVSGGGGGW